MKAINEKIKAKLQITKKFKSQLADAELELLKIHVSDISNEIKLLESELKVYELTLCEILADTGS